MEPVYINVNKPYEEKHMPVVFVGGVHFPKKIRTRMVIKDGEEHQIPVRSPQTRHYVEHEQDCDGNLLYVSPCGGVLREYELVAVAKCIIENIRYSLNN